LSGTKFTNDDLSEALHPKHKKTEFTQQEFDEFHVDVGSFQVDDGSLWEDGYILSAGTYFQPDVVTIQFTPREWAAIGVDRPLNLADYVEVDGVCFYPALPFPGGFVIAYMNKEGSKHYHYMVDEWYGLPEADGKDSFQHKYKIELPCDAKGPVIGGAAGYNGKAANQQHALPFTRGDIIQAIDMNQDAFLEETLKLVCLLKEFTKQPTGGDKTKQTPTIVGVREHIFSNIGALGDFAAGGEGVFGGMIQYAMTKHLLSRLHYGHPDFLKKTRLLSQGGMSMSDKNLNLSEDIFCGMAATLRGHTIGYARYITYAKGRDMGMDSVLGFFGKLSGGTARMTTTRHAYRLARRFGLARNLNWFYAHIGFYFNPAQQAHVLYLMWALGFVGTLADSTGFIPGIATPMLALLQAVFSYTIIIFIGANSVPLFLHLIPEVGVIKAIYMNFSTLFLKFAPCYFIIQSRFIGMKFLTEFYQGGEVATWRLGGEYALPA
jgi:hypothetical protein